MLDRWLKKVPKYNQPTSPEDSQINCQIHKNIPILSATEAPCPLLHSIAIQRAEDQVFFPDVDLCAFRSNCKAQRCFMEKNHITCSILTETSRSKLKNQISQLKTVTNVISKEQDWQSKFQEKGLLTFAEATMLILILIIIILVLILLLKNSKNKNQTPLYQNQRQNFGGGMGGNETGFTLASTRENSSANAESRV